MPHDTSLQFSCKRPVPPFNVWKYDCWRELHEDWYGSDEREWGITFEQYSRLAYRKYVSLFHINAFYSVFKQSPLV